MGRAKRRKRSMLGHTEAILVPRTVVGDDGRRWQRDPDGALYEIVHGSRRRIRGDDAVRAFERAERQHASRLEAERVRQEAKRIEREQREKQTVEQEEGATG